MAHRILLVTFGSLGDLHPYVGLARALAGRGHSVTVGASPPYRAAVEAAGVRFLPVGPDLSPLVEEGDGAARAMALRTGPAYVIRELVMPYVRTTYDDLAPAVGESDLVLTHPFVHAAPAAADVRRVRWMTVVLQPAAFASAYDPPIVPLPLLPALRRFGPAVFKPLNAFVRLATRSWVKAVDELHDELSLPRPRPTPTFGRFSPYGTLALFSSLLARPQRDWPPNTSVTGFVFHDEVPPDLPSNPAPGLLGPDALRRFLDEGPPPVVFTLGSSAVLAAGSFYEEAVRAVRRLRVRALLLVGSQARNVPDSLPADTAVASYASYAELFPRAAAIVHQGGIGTTAQALRAGRPMLVVPFSHDQPDNAARVERLGVSRTLSRARFCCGAPARELGALLEQGRYAERAEDVGRAVRAERGAEAAAEAAEAILSAPPRR